MYNNLHNKLNTATVRIITEALMILYKTVLDNVRNSMVRENMILLLGIWSFLYKLQLNLIQLKSVTVLRNTEH